MKYYQKVSRIGFCRRRTVHTSGASPHSLRRALRPTGSEYRCRLLPPPLPCASSESLTASSRPPSTPHSSSPMPTKSRNRRPGDPPADEAADEPEPEDSRSRSPAYSGFSRTFRGGRRLKMRGSGSGQLNTRGGGSVSTSGDDDKGMSGAQVAGEGGFGGTFFAFAFAFSFSFSFSLPLPLSLALCRSPSFFPFTCRGSGMGTDEGSRALSDLC